MRYEYFRVQIYPEYVSYRSLVKTTSAFLMVVLETGACADEKQYPHKSTEQLTWIIAIA